MKNKEYAQLEKKVEKELNHQMKTLDNIHPSAITSEQRLILTSWYADHKVKAFDLNLQDRVYNDPIEDPNEMIKIINDALKLAANHARDNNWRYVSYGINFRGYYSKSVLEVGGFIPKSDKELAEIYMKLYRKVEERKVKEKKKKALEKAVKSFKPASSKSAAKKEIARLKKQFGI